MDLSEEVMVVGFGRASTVSSSSIGGRFFSRKLRISLYLSEEEVLGLWGFEWEDLGRDLDLEGLRFLDCL